MRNIRPGNPNAYFSLSIDTCPAGIFAASAGWNRELERSAPHPFQAGWEGATLPFAGHWAHRQPPSAAKRRNRRCISSVYYWKYAELERAPEREMLALAIDLEEEDDRVYADYAEGLRTDFPASAAVFEGMRRGFRPSAPKRGNTMGHHRHPVPDGF